MTTISPVTLPSVTADAAPMGEASHGQGKSAAMRLLLLQAARAAEPGATPVLVPNADAGARREWYWLCWTWPGGEDR